MEQFKNIYFLIPEGARTGGPEAIYQFCNTARNAGYPCELVSVKGLPVPTEYWFSDDARPVYENYNIAFAKTVNINKDSLFIIPEIWAQHALHFRKSTVALWWLSVDNASISISKMKFLRDLDTYHLYQSDYARRFLELFSLKNCFSVSDYTSIQPIDDISGLNGGFGDRVGICYNPKRRTARYPSLIEKLKEAFAIWPIENVDKSEVPRLLQKARIYIDFGAHPGRDRIPREAAICGNLVVANGLGGSRSKADMNIPDEFILSLDSLSDECVLERLADFHENYGAYLPKQNAYRSEIILEKSKFENEVVAFLKCATRLAESDFQKFQLFSRFNTEETLAEVIQLYENADERYADLQLELAEVIHLHENVDERYADLQLEHGAKLFELEKIRSSVWYRLGRKIGIC